MCNLEPVDFVWHLIKWLKMLSMFDIVGKKKKKYK